MSGPVPEEEGKKRRRNKPKIPKTAVLPGAYSGKTPALPNARKYSKRTRDWYETWRHAEQAPTFTKTAWLTLHMLADLVEEYFKNPTPTAWAQIKQTQSGLLAMPADQRRSNFKVEPPKKDPVIKSSNVTDLSERRRQILADGA